MAGTRGGSQHPVDRLIRDLVETGRPATAPEIRRIVERLATAPFNPQRIRVPVTERGLSYQGEVLGAQAPSLAYHLIKRVVCEQQWALGTTAEEYVVDLRRAVRHPGARIIIYERWGDSIAAALAPTAEVVPAERRVPDARSNLFVPYSTRLGVLLTGYQEDTITRLDIPERVRWLR